MEATNSADASTPLETLKAAVLEDNPEQSVEDALVEFVHEQYPSANISVGCAFVHINFPNPENDIERPIVRALFEIEETVYRNGTVAVEIHDDYGTPHREHADIYAEDELYAALKEAN